MEVVNRHHQQKMDSRKIEQFVDYLHAVTLISSELKSKEHTNSKRYFEQLRVLIKLVHPDLNLRHSETLNIRDVRSNLILSCPSVRLVEYVNMIHANINHSTLAKRGWSVLKYVPPSTRPENTLVFFPPLDASSVRYTINYAKDGCVIVFVMTDTFYERIAKATHLSVEARQTLLCYIRSLVGEYVANRYVHSVSISNHKNFKGALKPLTSLAADINKLVPTCRRCEFCDVEEYRTIIFAVGPPICVVCRHRGYITETEESVPRIPILASLSSDKIRPDHSGEIPLALLGSYKVLDRYGTRPDDVSDERAGSDGLDSIVGTGDIRRYHSVDMIRSPQLKRAATPVIADLVPVFAPLALLGKVSELPTLHIAKSTSDLPVDAKIADSTCDDVQTENETVKPIDIMTPKKNRRQARAARFRRIPRSDSLNAST